MYSSSAGLAWLVIPKTWLHFSLGSMDFQSWRVFVVFCSVPSLTSALIFGLFMPESPKFLMEVFKGLTSAHSLQAAFPSKRALRFLSSLLGFPGERGHPCLPSDF